VNSITAWVNSLNMLTEGGGPFGKVRYSTDEGKHSTDEGKHSTDEGKPIVLRKVNTVLTKVNMY